MPTICYTHTHTHIYFVTHCASLSASFSRVFRMFSLLRYFDAVFLHVAIPRQVFSLHLVPVCSIFSSVYATLLRIASLLLIFFALHRRLLCSALPRSVLSAAFRPRAAIICPPSLLFYSSCFFLPLIQFIFLPSDSPSTFPAIYFTLLRSNYMPQYSTPLCITRFSFFLFVSTFSHYFTSLHYSSRINVPRLPYSLWSSFALRFSLSFSDTNVARVSFSLRCASHHPATLLFRLAPSSA